MRLDGCAPMGLKYRSAMAEIVGLALTASVMMRSANTLVAPYGEVGGWRGVCSVTGSCVGCPYTEAELEKTSLGQRGPIALRISIRLVILFW